MCFSCQSAIFAENIILAKKHSLLKMKKLLLTFVALVLACGIGAVAQIVTTAPAVLQENSTGVVLYYHADSPLGNDGMKNYTGDDVYAHIGVTTAAGDWQYIAAGWDTDLPKCHMTRVDANTYSLAIGDIRTFFGIKDGDHATRLCIPEIPYERSFSSL